MRAAMRRLQFQRASSSRSLSRWLAGLGLGLSVGLTLLGALSLVTPWHLARDLERLRASANATLEIERCAGLVYAVMADDLSALGRSNTGSREQRRERLARAHALLQRKDREVSGIDDETAFSWIELLETLEREGAQARGRASAADRRTAISQLRERLDLLAQARLGERLARLRGENASRLEYLASRVSGAADHPLLRVLGGASMRRDGLTSLFEAIAAERTAGALRRERWLDALDDPALESGLERHAREFERIRSHRGFNPDQRAPSFTTALASERAENHRASDGFEAHWSGVLERASRESHARFEAHVESLATWVRAVGALLFGITLGGGAMLLCIPNWIRRGLAEPLLNLTDQLRDPAAMRKANGSSWIELDELRETVRSLAERNQETHRQSMELAFYDSTTGVANRRYFAERLGNAIVSARQEARQLALICISLEDLSSGGDHLSADETNTILRQTATRLHELVRLSDLVGTRESAAQPGGISRTAEAEFALLLSGVRDPQDAARVADRVLAKLSRPFEIGRRIITLQSNLGLAIYPVDASTGDELLRSAQVALRHARQRGSNQYQFFSSHLNDVAARRFHVRNRLSGALERGDLSLLFQPVRDVASGRVSCAEVLMRWTDEEMGPVAPTEFIRVAEQTGLVGALGRWALEQACLQHRAWIEAGYAPIRVAVNVSPVQFAEDDWPEAVRSILECTGTSSSFVDLEITETALLKDGPATVATFEELVSLGVGLVVDDFGTGYSSISYLHRYPIDRIKIDRSFVSSIGDNGEGAGVSNAILAMAECLGLRVVAEGVETEQQAKQLIERGCGEIQGYLISQAVTGEEFVRFLEPAEKDEAS